jgi:hypothetical protein
MMLPLGISFPHSLAAQIKTGKCIQVRNLLRDLEVSENHLRVPSPPGQHKKDVIPDLGPGP